MTSVNLYTVPRMLFRLQAVSHAPLSTLYSPLSPLPHNEHTSLLRYQIPISTNRHAETVVVDLL